MNFLSKYGQILSNHEYWFNFDQGGLIYMEYFDPRKSLHVDLSLAQNVDNPDINQNNSNHGVYIVNHITETESRQFETMKCSGGLFAYTTEAGSMVPTIHCFDNCESKDEGFYQITNDLSGNKVELSFYKDRSVIQVGDTGFAEYNVYLNNQDDTVNFDQRIEQYVFFEKGFYSFDFATKELFTFTGNRRGLHKLFRKKQVTYNSPILDLLPTLVIINDEEEYQIFYDDLGMVTKIEIPGDPKKKLTFYDVFWPDPARNYGEFVSIHPLVFDPFNFESGETTLETWAMDKMVVTDNAFSFYRTIYHIDSEDLPAVYKELEEMNKKTVGA